MLAHDEAKGALQIGIICKNGLCLLLAKNLEK